MARKQRYPKPASGVFIKEFVAKNPAQEFYRTELENTPITFAIGPAGTAKTYVAIYAGLCGLLNGDFDRLVLTRPIVAVEDMGYLPGDMNDKIHPYMMPLFDAMEDMVGPAKAKELLEDGRVQVIPLAFMRGRSLNRSFIILDEAQNTTQEQMKMFLTRLGYDSKMAINGDSTQCDLPKHIESGLAPTVRAFSNGADPDITIVEFNESHIVRHELIGRMLRLLQAPGTGGISRPSRGVGTPSLLNRSSS